MFKIFCGRCGERLETKNISQDENGRFVHECESKEWHFAFNGKCPQCSECVPVGQGREYGVLRVSIHRKGSGEICSGSGRSVELVFTSKSDTPNMPALLKMLQDMKCYKA